MPRAPKQPVKQSTAKGRARTQFQKGRSGNPAGRPSGRMDFDRMIRLWVADHNAEHPDAPLDASGLLKDIGKRASSAKAESVFKALLAHMPKPSIDPINMDEVDLSDLDSLTERLVGQLFGGANPDSIKFALDCVQRLSDIRAAEAERRALEALTK